MASIFELVNSEDIVAYWRERSNETENLLGEELFDERQNDQKYMPSFSLRLRTPALIATLSSKGEDIVGSR